MRDEVFIALVVLLIFLKCASALTWSWWWVLMPIWLVLAAFFALFLLFIIIGLFAGFRKDR